MIYAVDYVFTSFKPKAELLHLLLTSIATELRVRAPLRHDIEYIEGWMGYASQHRPAGTRTYRVGSIKHNENIADDGTAAALQWT